VRLGDGGDDVEDVPGALFVDEGEVEVGAAGVGGLLIVAGEFAGEETAGQRAPDEEAGLFSFENGDEFALEVAAGDGVVSLQSVEAGERAEVGEGEGLGDLPGLPVGDTDVADLAGFDEVIESAEGFFDGGDGVVAVDLVEARWSVWRRRRVPSMESMMWPREAPMSLRPGPTRP
jgi:hypothetical protein